MNFFEQQDLARRNARWLLWLFLLSLALLILLANAAIAAALWFAESYSVYGGSQHSYSSYFTWQRLGLSSLAIGASVALVSGVKWVQLSGGGSQVAEAMGGRRILPQSDDAAERRCLNVVEELALAATMPVPPLYVLDQERGINAFAAGIGPADAVVAVTRGTLTQLRRHELEGIIAHEFSHILNGDMRLNIRLAALLKGITFLSDAGHLLLHGRRPAGGRQAAALPLIGIGLWLLGALGSLAAAGIKAAIGRQKEFLADASAVQFTRNPDTIGDALKVIGGYIPGTLVHAARASELSHIFFGEIRHRLWDTFASHPPLDARIRRIDPQWDGHYLQRRVDHAALLPGAVAVSPAAPATETVAALAGAASLAHGANTASPPAGHELPAVLLDNSHEPLGAIAIACGLLLHPRTSIRAHQREILQQLPIAGLAQLSARLEPALESLPPPQRLPLLECCLPALKTLSPEQYGTLKDSLRRLINADGEVELHEWCLYQVLRHCLDPAFQRPRPSRPRFASLERVSFHLRVVLSVLAREGSGEAVAVFRLAADELGLSRLQILPAAQCNVNTFSNGVRQLADCYPLLKPRLLKAMALAAGGDGQLNAAEREIIASVAAVMDCPSPPLPQ